MHVYFLTRVQNLRTPIDYGGRREHGADICVKEIISQKKIQYRWDKSIQIMQSHAVRVISLLSFFITGLESFFLPIGFLQS